MVDGRRTRDDEKVYIWRCSNGDPFQQLFSLVFFSTQSHHAMSFQPTNQPSSRDQTKYNLPTYVVSYSCLHLGVGRKFCRTFCLWFFLNSMYIHCLYMQQLLAKAKEYIHSTTQQLKKRSSSRRRESSQMSLSFFDD